jgi:hypothetical protein
LPLPNLDTPTLALRLCLSQFWAIEIAVSVIGKSYEKNIYCVYP